MEKEKEIEYKPGVGIDIGTANIVTARESVDGRFIYKFHRNMLYPLDISDESTDLLDRGEYLYVKTNDKYYIIGEDALSVCNAISGSINTIVRPMKDGVLNPSLSGASDLLFYIIKAILGKPLIENEPLRFTCPSNPINVDNDNRFHQMVLTNFFTGLGFVPRPINEASAVVIAANPKMLVDGKEIPLTGIAMSWGAGMVNCAAVYRGLSLAEFSCTKSGDNIDEQVEKVTGVSRSKIVKIKERNLDLDNIDMSDRVLAAIQIYYEETIERILFNINKQFREKSNEFDGEIEIVVAGGTAMAKGFIKKMEAIVKKTNLQFRIYGVRLVDDPFFSVAKGTLIRARSDYQKSLKK
jgi:actin-like ATPase involved in cell morphogenesis